MPIGNYNKKTNPATTPKAPQTAKSPAPQIPADKQLEGTVIRPEATGPISARKSVADAVTEDIDKAVNEGAFIEKKALNYAEMLQEEGISLDEAERIVEAVLIEGDYVETVPLTKNVTVDFRSRNYADYQRYLQAVEAYQPRYEQERAEISLRYFLASSLVRYRDRTFDFPDAKDKAAATAAFEERHDWLMAQPDVLIRYLAAKLHVFDRKVALCVREGVIENF